MRLQHSSPPALPGACLELPEASQWRQGYRHGLPSPPPKHQPSPEDIDGIWRTTWTHAGPAICASYPRHDEIERHGLTTSVCCTLHSFSHACAVLPDPLEVEGPQHGQLASLHIKAPKVDVPDIQMGQQVPTHAEADGSLPTAMLACKLSGSTTGVTIKCWCT